MARGTGLGIDLGADMVKVVQVRVWEREVQVLGAATFSRRSLGVEGDDPDALARAAAARTVQRELCGRPALAGLSGRQALLAHLRTSRDALPEVLGQEVRQAAGSGLDAFAWDTRPLEAAPPGSTARWVAAAARQNLLEARSAAFAAGGLPLDGFCPDAAALASVFLRSLGAEPRGTAALLDIGAERTHLVIVRHQAFVFAGTLPLGGHRFTQAVAEALGVDADRAEEIKCRRGAVLSESELRAKPSEEAHLPAALLRVATELSGAVQAAALQARIQTGLGDLDPERYYLVGSAARLDGLREHLQAALGRPVRWLDLGGWLAGGQAVAEPPSPYAVALGLALAAADPDAFALRLVPERTRRRQQFWRRGIYALVAAALVSLAIAAHLVGTLREERTRRAELAALADSLQQARDAEQRIEQQCRRIEALHRQAARLADQARANGVLLRTLDALRRAVPDSVSLRSLTFAANPDPPQGAGRARLAFTLMGAAAQRGTADAREELDAFVRRLEAEPLRATALPPKHLGAPAAERVDFELTFYPSEAPAAMP
jgi:cell division ATPase FtsA